MQVYPGLCYPEDSTNCPGPTNLAIAVPPQPDDLETNWTKDVFTVNPIVNDTGVTLRPPADPRRRVAPHDLRHDDYGQHGLQDVVPHRQAAGLPPRVSAPPLPDAQQARGAGAAPAGAVTPTSTRRPRTARTTWWWARTLRGRHVLRQLDRPAHEAADGPRVISTRPRTSTIL